MAGLQTDLKAIPNSLCCEDHFDNVYTCIVGVAMCVCVCEHTMALLQYQYSVNAHNICRCIINLCISYLSERLQQARVLQMYSTKLAIYKLMYDSILGKAFVIGCL